MSDQPSPEKVFAEGWLIEQFTSKAGERVLKYLRTQYGVDRTVFGKGVQTTEAAWADGARLPFIQLANLIEKSRNQKPKQRKAKS